MCKNLLKYSGNRLAISRSNGILKIEMPMRIDQPELEARLDRLAARQPVVTTKHALSVGILARVVEACSDDPEAWLTIGQQAKPTATQQEVA